MLFLFLFLYSCCLLFKIFYFEFYYLLYILFLFLNNHFKIIKKISLKEFYLFYLIFLNGKALVHSQKILQHFLDVLDHKTIKNFNQ